MKRTRIFLALVATLVASSSVSLISSAREDDVGEPINHKLHLGDVLGSEDPALEMAIKLGNFVEQAIIEYSKKREGGLVIICKCSIPSIKESLLMVQKKHGRKFERECKKLDGLVRGMEEVISAASLREEARDIEGERVAPAYELLQERGLPVIEKFIEILEGMKSELKK